MTWFSIAAWKERRRAFRDLKSQQDLDHRVLILDDGNLVNRAKVAVEAGDRTAALQFWQQALVRYPAFAKTSRDALDVLIGLERYQEAEELMLEGLKRRRRDLFCAEGYAMIAQRRGDLDTAVERWAQVRKTFPGAPAGYVFGAKCLRESGRLDAADTLNAASIRRFSADQRVWMERAQIAEDRNDLEEALRRWQDVAVRFPHVVSEQGVTRVLQKLGRLDEADARLTDARRRFPLVPTLAIAHAQLAEQRGDKEEAVRRWAGMMRRFPRLPQGYREACRILLELDRAAEADAALLDAVERLPDDAWPAIEHASLASKRHEWTDAAARWAWVRERWPERPEGYTRGAEALSALGRRDEAEEMRAAFRKRRQQAVDRSVS
jgi:tetratricopeptide (TPR) repeat protein